MAFDGFTEGNSTIMYEQSYIDNIEAEDTMTQNLENISNNTDLILVRDEDLDYDEFSIISVSGRKRV